MTHITLACDERPICFSVNRNIFPPSSPTEAMPLEHKLEPEYFFPLFADNLFCDLTPASIESLGKIKQTKRFQNGVRFFSAGDLPRCVYVLVAGEAHLRFTDKSKDMSIARPIEPNEILGVTETIAGLPYETTAETLTSCLCECIRREDFIRFLEDEPEVCFRLVRMLGISLQKSYKIFCSSIN